MVLRRRLVTFLTSDILWQVSVLTCRRGLSLQAVLVLGSWATEDLDQLERTL